MMNWTVLLLKVQPRCSAADATACAKRAPLKGAVVLADFFCTSARNDMRIHSRRQDLHEARKYCLCTVPVGLTVQCIK